MKKIMLGMLICGAVIADSAPVVKVDRYHFAVNVGGNVITLTKGQAKLMSRYLRAGQAMVDDSDAVAKREAKRAASKAIDEQFEVRAERAAE